MASNGNVQGLQACSHQEYMGDLWQDIAEIGAAYGHLDVVRLIHDFYTLDMASIGVIARDAGHPDIASWATGTPWALNLQAEYNPFPLNIGVDRSVPEATREWEMVDWDETFEEPDTLMSAMPTISENMMEVGGPIPEPDEEDRMDSIQSTLIGSTPGVTLEWQGADDTLNLGVDATSMQLQGNTLVPMDDEDAYLSSRLQGVRF